MKQFLDRDWLAPNVMRVGIDPAIAASFADLALEPVPAAYHVERRGWSSDNRWISEAQEAASRFQAAFNAMDVTRHVRDYVVCDRDIRL